jgi:hypothetical protein
MTNSHAFSWRKLRRWSAIFAAMGVTAAGVGAYAAANWDVDLAGAASGLARSAPVSNLTISAVASPAADHPLYPGATGDVVVSIVNPNHFPVTLTAVQLPSDTTYASGFTDTALTISKAGCLATTPSDVSWNLAAPTSGSTHVLSTPLTVGASGTRNDPLTVTLTDAAFMENRAPVACASTYFLMPPLTSLTATGGSALVTSTPAVDGWTS